VLALPESLRFGEGLGLAVVAVLAFWLYRTASGPDPADRGRSGAIPR
jgi:hypothetical protein